MHKSQKDQRKQIEEIKDREGVLVCYRCLKPVEVVDKENDLHESQHT